MPKPILYLRVRRKHHSKVPRLAGMVRGLLNSFEGYRSISGLTDSRFASHKYVCLRFSTVGSAESFKNIADVVLGKYIEVQFA